jgi:hypothetical protein
MFITLALFTPACDSEQNDPAGQIRLDFSNALADYGVCVADDPNECHEVETALVNTLPAAEDIGFRKLLGGATASCFSESVSCSGQTCASQDFTGCFCTDGQGTVVSAEFCPSFWNMMMGYYP